MCRCAGRGRNRITTDLLQHALQVDYSVAELNSLALLFTIPKLLYQGGALVRCAQAVRLLQPAQESCSRPLHTTMIRNEAAYFGCCAQLLQSHPPPPLQQPLTTDLPRPIFLCGDSHCLPGKQLTHCCMSLLPKLCSPPISREFVTKENHKHNLDAAYQKSGLRYPPACSGNCPVLDKPDSCPPCHGIPWPQQYHPSHISCKYHAL